MILEPGEPTPHPSAAQPPSPSRGEGGSGASATTEPPSPLEGEGARRADEGSRVRQRARREWRTPRTPQLRHFAKAMRSEPTEAEAKLWPLLRNRRLVNFKFRRQLPIGHYIADFVCLDARLIIEADGSQHTESAYDSVRDGYLQAQGFRVLRLSNYDILAHPDAVLDTIWAALHEVRS